MKKLYLSLFLFNFIMLSPYTLNGMLTRGMRNIKVASSIRYNTNLTMDGIPSTLPQTFFQKLFGIKKPNPKYYKRLREIEKEEEKKKFTSLVALQAIERAKKIEEEEKKEKKKELEKKLEMIYTIGSIIPLEKLQAAAWERHNATNSPLAQKDWIRIHDATWRHRNKAKWLRNELGLPFPYYKNQDNLGIGFHDDFYNHSHFLPENKELLDLKNETIAALTNLNNSQSTSE